MKKIISLLLAACLILSLPFFVLAEEDDGMRAEIKEAFDSFCKEKGFKFEHDSQGRSWAYATFDIDSAFKQLDVTAFMFSDMLAFTAEPAFKVSEENRANMLIFLSLINNNDLFYSHFNFDYEKGTIESFSSIVVKKDVPNSEEIGVLLAEALMIFEDYGDSLMKVALGADPVATYAELSKKK